MLTAIMLALSVVSGAQFFLGYWRALLAGMAAQPVSEKLFVAAGFERVSIHAEDFGRLLSLHRLMPDLKSQPNSVWRLRTHYAAVSILRPLPGIGAWAQKEMGMCANCLAVLVDQRLLLNLACASEARSL